LRLKKLVYDSHEYFTGTPELQKKPLKRKFWKCIESLLLPKLKQAYTVNQSIAAIYKKEYGIEMKVVRNVPLCKQYMVPPDVALFPSGKFILLLQGAGINKDRGADDVIESMNLLPEPFFLIFIGSGDAWEQLQAKTRTLGLTDKIRFIPKVPFAVLKSYTKGANLGLSLDKLTCQNHKLSLPNKLFDYIHAGVPVLSSSVIEVKRIIEGYNIGMCLDEVSPKSIADAILLIYNNKTMYDQWKLNTAIAAREFCWENEQSVLDEIFKD
jgi:glycosyltransferase involved in cell wall biosynthesis